MAKPAESIPPPTKPPTRTTPCIPVPTRPPPRNQECCPGMLVEQHHLRSPMPWLCLRWHGGPACGGVVWLLSCPGSLWSLVSLSQLLLLLLLLSLCGGGGG